MSMLGARLHDEMLRTEAAPFFAQVEESQQGNSSTLTGGGRGEHNMLRHEERHLFLQIPVPDFDLCLRRGFKIGTV